jgi:hypothetical protein
VKVQFWLAVVTTPPVTTRTGKVPDVAFLGALAVNDVELTNVVGYGISFTQITLCRVKPVPVAVTVALPAPDAVDGVAVVKVGLVAGLRVEACDWFGVVV